MLDTILSNLKLFREQIYSSIQYRADACMDLLDSLCSNTTADTPVKLSLNQNHRRTYNSITDVVSEFHNGAKIQDDAILDTLIEQAINNNNDRNYYLFATDCTPAPRVHAKTLSDQGIIYSPNPVANNKSITIGHKYSVNVFLPSKNKSSPPWCLPLSTKRIPTDTDETLLGASQLQQSLDALDKQDPDKLCINVVDSGYCKPEYIDKLHSDDANNADLITIVRAKSNRVIWRKSQEKHSIYSGKRGHELWYGDKFEFKNKDTWHDPDNTFNATTTTNKVKECFIEIQAWNDMLMRQKRGIPMNNYPFTLSRVTVTDNNGEYLFHKPMWLMIFGGCRKKITLQQIYQDYMQRYHIEHFFKFDKNHLLSDKLQTTDTQHAKNWWSICSLAYSILFVARLAAEKISYPWERYLPESKQSSRIPSASQVQRSFHKITNKIGSPATTPKP